MRPVLMGDVIAAARALRASSPDQRVALAHELVRAAHAADRCRRRTGRGVRGLGNGSLMAAALARPHVAEPRLGDADYLRCLIVVLQVLLERREAHGRGAALSPARRRHSAAPSDRDQDV